MDKKNMSYENASDLALKLKRQGSTYAEIEKHLQSIDYVSDRTKKPVKEMAIRYMIAKAEKEELADKRQEKAEEQHFATTNKRDNDIRTLLAAPLPSSLKLELIEALVNYQPTGRVATTQLLETRA